jgi:hypothetical protein
MAEEEELEEAPIVYPKKDRHNAYTIKTWLYGLFFAIFTFVVITGFIAQKGNFFAQLSRWAYLYYAIMFPIFFLGAWVSWIRKIAFFFIFFSLELAVVWVFLTTILVIVGIGAVLANVNPADQALGFLLIGLAFIHYSPIVIVIIYVGEQRDRLAKYWGNFARSVIDCGGWGPFYVIMVAQLFVALIPVIVYRFLFNPFVEYDLSPDSAMYLAIEIVAVAVIPVSGVLLFMYIFYDPGYRRYFLRTRAKERAARAAARQQGQKTSVRV